jgi:hypothetical protein
MTIACRGCGRLMKYDGSHRRCGRCRYHRPLGGKSVKRICPLCARVKAAKSLTCSDCYESAIHEAKNKLRDAVREAIPPDVLRHRSGITPERQLRPLPRGYDA